MRRAARGRKTRSVARQLIATYLDYLGLDQKGALATEERGAERLLDRLLDLIVAERALSPAGHRVDQRVELIQVSADTRNRAHRRRPADRGDEADRPAVAPFRRLLQGLLARERLDVGTPRRGRLVHPHPARPAAHPRRHRGRGADPGLGARTCRSLPRVTRIGLRPARHPCFRRHAERQPPGVARGSGVPGRRQDRRPRKPPAPFARSGRGDPAVHRQAGIAFACRPRSTTARIR